MLGLGYSEHGHDPVGSDDLDVGHDRFDDGFALVLPPDFILR
jgi:hypothetical protein